MELTKLYLISLFEIYEYIDKNDIQNIINKNLSIKETYEELVKLKNKTIYYF